jgi:hypothetical protein
MKVRIGGIFYDVLDIEGLAEGTQRLDGHIQYGPNSISLNANLGSGTRAVVLWHEILHAILTHAGQRQLNESVMDALAYGIAQVVADNRHIQPPGIGDGIISHDGVDFCAVCGTALGANGE